MKKINNIETNGIREILTRFVKYVDGIRGNMTLGNEFKRFSCRFFYKVFFFFLGIEVFIKTKEESFGESLGKNKIINFSFKF